MCSHVKIDAPVCRDYGHGGEGCMFVKRDM